MRVLVLLLVFMTAVTACQPAVEGDSPTDNGESVVFVTTPRINLEERGVSLSGDGFAVSMRKPANWESFTTEYGIVLGEQFGSVATGGELEGVMAYMFASPVSDFALPTAEGPAAVNLAHIIQKQIVASEEYVGTARVSEPVPFRWDAFDASYYLLHDDSLAINTMVIGVYLPESAVLLTCTISAPASQAGRIRGLLPNLVRGMSINGHNMSADAILSLPDPLEFPQE